MTIALPLLTIVADIVDVSRRHHYHGEVGVTGRFVEQTIETLAIVDLLHGLSKSIFFGYLIGIIGCWNGLKTYGGTEGVGIATTKTVVYLSIAILVSDFALTRIFLAIYG